MSERASERDGAMRWAEQKRKRSRVPRSPRLLAIALGWSEGKGGDARTEGGQVEGRGRFGSVQAWVVHGRVHNWVGRRGEGEKGREGEARRWGEGGEGGG